jgi:hypothetical protein
MPARCFILRTHNPLLLPIPDNYARRRSSLRMPARVEPVMTTAAEHDEIFFPVRPQLASPNYVMDLELIAPATALALPAIPLQNFRLELAVMLEVEPKPMSSGNVHTHADRLISSKNRRCCGAGRKWSSRCTHSNSTSGFPFSRFAPARKSAQIISRQ